MVTALRMWGSGGFTHILPNTRCLRTSQREVTPPVSHEQRAGGVTPNTDNQSVGRPILRFGYSALSSSKSQLSPFYGGKSLANLLPPALQQSTPSPPGGAYLYRGMPHEIFPKKERNRT